MRISRKKDKRSFPKPDFGEWATTEQYIREYNRANPTAPFKKARYQLGNLIVEL